MKSNPPLLALLETPTDVRSEETLTLPNTAVSPEAIEHFREMYKRADLPNRGLLLHSFAEHTFGFLPSVPLKQVLSRPLSSNTGVVFPTPKKPGLSGPSTPTAGFIPKVGQS